MQGHQSKAAPAEAGALRAEPTALRVAFLEDDPDQADRVGSLLRGAGHRVYVFSRSRSMVDQLRMETYDLIVLDWEVPDLTGYEVLCAIRTKLELRTPVLFLTHRDSEADVVRALEAGADDYLIKPPRERELLARVEAVCRRKHEREPAGVSPTMEVPPFTIDLEARRILRDGQPIELTRRDFEVALLLFRNVGKVLSRGFIMDTVWGRGDPATSRTVDMHVSRVRNLLGLSSAIGLRLIAVYGYGYRLERTGAGMP